MNVLVCYKIVYEEQDIVVNADSSLNFDRAELKLSLYDLNAVEEGARIAEATGAAMKVLTVGDDKTDNSKLRKGILSRGASELLVVKDAALKDADSFQTAQVLAAAAKKAGFDLILCGEGSGDIYAQQTGIQLGELLNVPVLNAVSKIMVRDGFVDVERTLEDGIEVLSVTLPCVLCVTSDINTTRVPSMKDILGAGKKPVMEWTLADLGIGAPEAAIEVLSVLAPKQAERKRIVFEGEDKVSELAEKLSKEIA